MGRSKPKSLLFSLLLSYFISAIMLFVLAAFIYRLKLRALPAEGLIYGIYAISCLFGGFLCAKRIGSKRLIWGSISGILYALVLIFISCMLSRSFQPELPACLRTLAFCTAGGAFGGILS